MSPKGLFQQLKNTSKLVTYSTGAFSMDSLTEVIEEMALEEQRRMVRLIMQEGIRAGKITQEERIQLENLMDTSDRDNIYMAEQIVKFKIEQI